MRGTVPSPEGQRRRVASAFGRGGNVSWKDPKMTGSRFDSDQLLQHGAFLRGLALCR